MAAVTTALRDMDVNVLTTLNIQNGMICAAPVASSMGYISSGNEWVVYTTGVAPPAAVAGGAPGPAAAAAVAAVADLPNVGASGSYNAVAQYLHARQKGIDADKAAFQAGARSGLLQAVKVMNWAIHGSGLDGIRRHIGLGDLPEPGPFADAAAAAVFPDLQWDVLADEAEYIARLDLRGGAGMAIHENDRIPFRSLGRNQTIVVAIRRDEIVAVDGNTAYSQALIRELSEADTKKFFKEGTDAVATLAVVIAAHMWRSGGHHFYSVAKTNVALPFFTAAVKAVKPTLPEKTLMSLMHDMLHPVGNLTGIVHTMMSIGSCNGLVNEAANFRYPFSVVGAGVVTTAGAAARKLLELCRTRVGAQNLPSYKLLREIGNILNGQLADVIANHVRWGPSIHADRELRDRKIAAMKRFAAVLYGYMVGLKFSEEDSLMKSPTMMSAASAHPGLVDQGKKMGTELAGAKVRVGATIADAGLGADMLTLCATWSVGGAVVPLADDGTALAIPASEPAASAAGSIFWR